MIYCNYDFHFKKVKQKNRIISIPILKNTCINCKHKEECNITKMKPIRQNNELLLESFYQLKDYIEECILEYKRVEYEIENGVYSETYTHKVMVLDDVPNKKESVTYKTDPYGVTDQYTVYEYLIKYPQDRYVKKLVGIHKVKEVSDVLYGLNIKELESDLEYINQEISRLNEKNKITKRSF